MLISVSDANVLFRICVCCLLRLDSVHVFPLIKRVAFVGVCAYLCLLIKQAYVSQTVRVQAFCSCDLGLRSARNGRA